MIGEILSIPERSIVVLTDPNLADPDALEVAHRELAKVAGHDRFLVLALTPGADVAVLSGNLRVELARLGVVLTPDCPGAHSRPYPDGPCSVCGAVSPF